MKNKPNPGSKEAEKAGCTCPVIDNHFGKGRPDGSFIFDMECPVHNWEEVVINKSY